MIDLDIRVRIHGLYLAKLQRVDCAFVKGQSVKYVPLTLQGECRGWLLPGYCGIWQLEGYDEYRHRGCAVSDTSMER
jgi:hypothetical protein